MSRYDRVPFDLAGDFTAHRAFKFQNHSFAKGAKFPWRRICCSQRKLKLLFDGNYIALKAKELPDYEPKKAEYKSEKKADKPKVEKKKKADKPKVEKTEDKAEDKSTDEDIKAFVNDQS